MHDGTAGTSGPQITERYHLRERGPRACPQRSATPDVVSGLLADALGERPRFAAGPAPDPLVVTSQPASPALRSARRVSDTPCARSWPLPTTGCPPAATGRGKGGPQAHPVGTNL